MSDFQYFDSKLKPNYDGGLLDNKFVAGTLFIFQTKAQRNAMGKDYRLLDGATTTLAYISGTKELFQLINNPDGVTTDSDWDSVDIGHEALLPIGTWDAITGIIGGGSTQLLDTGATGINGNFYIVTGAPSGHTATYPGLFESQEVTVNDSDWIVSVGEYWAIIPEGNVTWATLPGKPQTILDYVTGTVIAHTHAIANVTDLQTILDDKLDTSDVADEVIGFDSVNDADIVSHVFAKTHYYRKWVAGVDKNDSTFSAAEIETMSGGGGSPSAINVSYDPSGSPLTSINVQDALDEVATGGSGWKVTGDTTLIGNSRILGAYTLDFGDGGGGNLAGFTVDVTGAFSLSASTNGVLSADVITISGENNILVIDNTGFEVTLDGTDTFREDADYSANYVDRSYITKGWANTTYLPLTGTATFNEPTYDIDGKSVIFKTGADQVLDIGPGGIIIGSTTRAMSNSLVTRHTVANTVVDIFSLDARNSVTPVAGFGSRFKWMLVDNTSSKLAGAIDVIWTDADEASRTSVMKFYVIENTVETLLLTLGAGGVITPSLGLDLTAGDISSPIEGQIWYNNTTNKFRVKEGSSVINLREEQVVGTTDTTTASTSGSFSGISGAPNYPNNSILNVEIILIGIKSGGTVGVTARRNGFFRKDNSGTWTVDFQEALVTSDSLIISDAKLDINGGWPGITYDTGVDGGSFELDKYIKIKVASL